MPGKPRVILLFSRRAHPGWSTAFLSLGVGLLLLLQACAGPAPNPSAASIDALLLSPVDFPQAGLREMQRLGQRETRDGGQTTQVSLQSDRIRLFQVVVAFPSEDAARKAFETIRQERAQEQLKIIPDAPTLGQESVVLAGKQGDQDAVSIAFRHEQLLVRINLMPAREIAELLPYARKAEEKVRQARSR